MIHFPSSFRKCVDQDATSSREINRRGYTLLELILSLGLSIVVLLIIGMAIQLYLFALTEQQAFIERKQVARGILEMVGNDLRAAIQYKAEDYSDLENLVQTQTLQLNQALAPIGEEGEEGEAAAEEEAPPIVDEENVDFRPTFLGTEQYILLDISRLPRLDEYNPLVANFDSDVQTPSDVKSLAYFISLTEGGSQSEVQFATTSAPGGLYRRSIDRAVAAYRGDTSLIEEPDEYTQLVAGEIAQIQFRYFDGEEWQTEWDSVERNGFPPAVEITLVLDPARATAGSNYAYGGFNQDTMETFRSVVHLPAAEIMELPE